MERRDLIYEMKKDVKVAAYISMTDLAKHLGKGKAYDSRRVEIFAIKAQNRD